MQENFLKLDRQCRSVRGIILEVINKLATDFVTGAIKWYSVFELLTGLFYCRYRYYFTHKTADM